MTERQADQKWVDDTRAEYLRRAQLAERNRYGLLAFIRAIGGKP